MRGFPIIANTANTKVTRKHNAEFRQETLTSITTKKRSTIKGKLEAQIKRIREVINLMLVTWQERIYDPSNFIMVRMNNGKLINPATIAKV
ncbi:hypothetical protein KY284_016823 [Solanum tuberosum]|nr:hypothetical protein KY284_016823 [Solanum tuberosum]